MAGASLAGINYFAPIFSFLLVFILIYAILTKTKVLGDNKPVHLMVSFLLAIFFIVNVSLVDFVNFSSAWFAVFIVCIFFILVLLTFTHGNVDLIKNAKWVGWVLIAALIVFFILSSAHVFAWTVNWARVTSWFYTDWFGFVVLLILAAIVSWVLSKK